MKPLTLEEFAQELRRSGGIREADFADEILELSTIQKDVAEPYSDLCEELAWDTPDNLKGNPCKQAEYLRDRSNLLADIEAALEKAKLSEGCAPNGRTWKIDADDAVKALLETLESARCIIGVPNGCDDETFLSELQALADRAPAKLEYDL